ncbi:MAG: cation:proton antiporter [Bryobacteraceae bacterium]
MLEGHNLLAFLAASSQGDALALPLSMLIIFGSAKLLAALFERIGQSGIVGQILAGVLVGPQLLNWIHPDNLLHALAELGVIFLLFRVGLEVKSSELFRVGGTALVVATLGVIVPFVSGWLILMAFGKSKVESSFVGAAMVATSVGITAQVLAAKGLLDERASKIILAAAVFDDVLGLLALAVVTSMAEGEINWMALATTAAVAIGFTLLVAIFGSRAAKRVVPRIEERFTVGEVQFDIALVVLFALSVLAVKAGVAAIIGAFLGGMAMAETVNERVHVLAHGIAECLLPFFLVGIGLNLNLHSVAHEDTLWLAVIVIVAAVLSKLVGAGIGAAHLGLRDMFRIGSGMVPRGEVGMVVAQIGLALHVIETSVYAVVVLMAVATTIIAPPLLNLSFRRAGYVSREAQEQYRIG